MKRGYALIAAFTVMMAQPSDASVDPNFEHHARITACKLSPAESAVLNARWNKLAMKHFMVSMEQRIAPGEAQRIRREVDEGLAALKREFGAVCVLDII